VSLDFQLDCHVAQLRNVRNEWLDVNCKLDCFLLLNWSFGCRCCGPFELSLSLLQLNSLFQPFHNDLTFNERIFERHCVDGFCVVSLCVNTELHPHFELACC